jgi:hypothetical protein
MYSIRKKKHLFKFLNREKTNNNSLELETNNFNINITIVDSTIVEY